MSKFTFTLLAAAAVAGASSPASAQRYFMRGAIPGIKSEAAAAAPQVKGSWTMGAWDTSGACVSGKRTERRTATCQADGATNAVCDGNRPADETRQITCYSPLTCKTPRNTWVGGGHTSYVRYGNAADEAEMLSICRSHPENGAGLCTWQGPGNVVGYAIGPNSYEGALSNQPTWRVARCDPQ